MVDDDRFSSKIVENATEGFTGHIPRIKTLQKGGRVFHAILRRQNFGGGFPGLP